MSVTIDNAAEVLSRFMLPDVFPYVLDLERSQGNRLYDAKGKRSYLDCCGYLASNPVGHNHPKMHDPNFEKKLLRAARAKPTNSDFYTVEMAEFVDTFSRVAIPAEFKHLFFVEGGTLGVENALKAAFDWKIRLNQSRGIRGEVGTQVIHFKEAFHGRSGYTLSLTNTADPRKYKFFPKFDWPRVINPKITFPLEGENIERVVALERQAIAQIEEAFRKHGADIAAIIIEPVQAEGGDNHFRPEFHQALRLLADENEVMLIYDEIQTGVGVSGKIWTYQHYPVVPDMICFGKKMQVCGMMTTARIEEVDYHVFEEASRINSTWGGNLVDMVRAQRYLEIIEEDRLLDNVRVVGEKLVAMLRELQMEFPKLYTNARGIGLLCAIDAANPELRNTLAATVLEEGAIILKCGERSLRFRPALTFSEQEVAELAQLLRKASAKVAGAK